MFLKVCCLLVLGGLLSPCPWRSVVPLSLKVCCLLVPKGLLSPCPKMSVVSLSLKVLSPCSLGSVVSCSLGSVVFLSDGLSVVCLSLMVFLLSACFWWSFSCFIVIGGMCCGLLVPGGLLSACFWGSVCCCLVPECLSAVSLPLRVCVLSPFHWGSVLSSYHWGSVLCLFVTEGLSTFSLSLRACVLSGCPRRSAVKGNSSDVKVRLVYN